MGSFDLTDRRACGYLNGHCPECGRSTPSLRAHYCSIACRYDVQEAQRWEEYEPTSREKSVRPTDAELVERETEQQAHPERVLRHSLNSLAVRRRDISVPPIDVIAMGVDRVSDLTNNGL